MVVDNKVTTERLDSTQYTMDGLKAYELIFGEGFLSSGGVHTTREFLKILDLKEGERVLDVGSGLGGSAFMMAGEYKAKVVGIDLSSNMIALAQEKLAAGKGFAKLPGVQERVSFKCEDIFKSELEDGSFDVVYSRDAVLHIEDKLTLFKKLFALLKPGGRVMISDYCFVDPKERAHSEEFKQYLASRDYFLCPLAEYKGLLEQAGFENVEAQDRTQMWHETLKRELGELDAMQEEFVNVCGQEQFDKNRKNWVTKVARSAEGEQTWGLFVAYKPSA